MNISKMEALDRRIGELEAKLAKLKAIRSVFADADFAAEIRELFGTDKPVAARPKVSRTKGTTVAERLVAFFRSRDNEWATLSEIGRSGIKVPSARQVLYTLRAGDFDRQNYTGGGKPTKFRLKEGASAVIETIGPDGTITKKTSSNNSGG